LPEEQVPVTFDICACEKASFSSVQKICFSIHRFKLLHNLRRLRSCKNGDRSSALAAAIQGESKFLFSYLHLPYYLNVRNPEELRHLRSLSSNRDYISRSQVCSGGFRYGLEPTLVSSAAVQACLRGGEITLMIEKPFGSQVREPAVRIRRETYEARREAMGEGFRSAGNMREKRGPHTG